MFCNTICKFCEEEKVCVAMWFRDKDGKPDYVYGCEGCLLYFLKEFSLKEITIAKIYCTNAIKN